MYRWPVLIMILLGWSVYSQTAAPVKLLPYSHKVMYVSLPKDPSVIDYYRKTHKFTSTNLYLYQDNTFLFYYSSQNEYCMALGSYKRENDVLYLLWDSLKTEKAVTDAAFYVKYNQFVAPRAIAVNNWMYTVKEFEIEPYTPGPGVNKLELLYSSTDLYTSGKVVDDFKEIKYDNSGNSIIIVHGDNKEEVLPKFRIWGFVIHDGVSSKVYRRTKKGFNWYGIPGAQIAQLDGLVIYTIGDKRRYSYFSRNLDSPILPLNLKELKKEFRDNKKFVISLMDEFHSKNRILSDLDEHFHSYRVIELYRKSVDARDGL